MIFHPSISSDSFQFYLYLKTKRTLNRKNAQISKSITEYKLNKYCPKVLHTCTSHQQLALFYNLQPYVKG